MRDASAYRPTDDLRVNFVSSADGVFAVGGRSVSLPGPVDSYRPCHGSRSLLSVRMAVAQEQGLGATLHKRYVGAVHHASNMSEALLESVQIYLREHRNMTAAAQALSVHVNTLRYRLDKYEGITGASLDELEDLVEVWWALEYERIMERRSGLDDAK